MFNEQDLSHLSYRELQVLAARHRVPGNIKKHMMIKVILASRRGDNQEVIRILNELQQTRKKKIKKIPKERKTPLKSVAIHNTHYQENRYYAHQQQTSFHCASNLQLVAEEEISTGEGAVHPNISNFEDIHEYLVRVQRDYHFNINNGNNNECAKNPIVDLRMNEQKSIIHQSLPLDLHRASNILLSSDYNRKNDNNKIDYFFNKNNSLQTPLLLKKMLQAPVGTNLKEIAGPDGIYCVYSHNNLPINEFLDDSDTLTAESGSDANDDIDNSGENLSFILNSNKNPLAGMENQNLLDDNNVQELNSTKQNHSSDNNYYQMETYQSADIIQQRNLQKWTQNNVETLANNMAELNQDNEEMLNAICYANQNLSQERGVVNNAQTNPDQYQTQNNFQTISNGNYNNCNNNYYWYNNNNNNNNDDGSRIESSNSSSQQNIYNYQNDNSNAIIVDNNAIQNHDNNYYNDQNRSMNDTNDYTSSQLYNLHESKVCSNNYTNFGNVASQQLNDFNDVVSGFSKKNETNSERCNNSEYYYHNSYLQNCQLDYNIDHNVQTHVAVSNDQHQQVNNKREYQEIEENRTTNHGDLEAYYPRWERSRINHNLEHILNIRKYNDELDESKNDETSSVFCYSAPIVTPKQLIVNANVCTQEKCFFVKKRKNSLLKINNSQVYSDTTQGQKMANVMNDLNLNSVRQTKTMNNEKFSSNDENNSNNDMDNTDSNNLLHDLWTIDSSNNSCDI